MGANEDHISVVQDDPDTQIHSIIQLPYFVLTEVPIPCTMWQKIPIKLVKSIPDQILFLCFR